MAASAAVLPLIATCGGGSNTVSDDVASDGGPEFGPDGHFREVQIYGDGTRHLIPIEDIVDGGPGKDGIPSIDEPQFAGREHWSDLDYRDDGLVMGVEVNGTRRAYPFQVLVWHEIVNDRFGDEPMLVTYCPLCGSGVVFRRRLASGAEPEFGVSGRLYNSDMLMYDRLTDSVWVQLTGTAVIGELTGEKLELYPSEILTWADWKRAYPDSEVLTRDTGFPRDYDRQPYGDYDQRVSISFPVVAEDDRLHPKTRVTGVEIEPDHYGAYADDIVSELGPINDTLGGVPLLVAANPSAGGNVVVHERRVDQRTLTFQAAGSLLVDVETETIWDYDGTARKGTLAGSQLRLIPTTKAFWFAWFAFHQQTALWLPDGNQSGR